MAKKQVYEVTVDDCGNIFWRRSGKLHRLDGPAIEYANGNKEWYQNGELHRIGGPAIEYVSGTKYWCQNGKSHRIGGPAVERADGTKIWCQNDKIHRLDGPAAEWASGDKEYWIEGVWHSEQEYFAKIAEMKAPAAPLSCAGKIVTIDGKQYKLQEV